MGRRGMEPSVRFWAVQDGTSYVRADQDGSTMLSVGAGLGKLGRERSWIIAACLL